MSRLPAGWTTATLERACVVTEQVTPALERNFQYIDISSVDRSTKRIIKPQETLGSRAPSRARKLVRSGDTLVSMTRPNLNAVALVDSHLDGQIASTGFEVLRAPGMDPRWLGYLVRSESFINAMSGLVQGALYPAVRSKDVRSFIAPFAPAAEQQRIADKVDTVLARVDACRDRLARVAPLLKRFRQSVLSAATSEQLIEKHVLGRTCNVEKVPLMQAVAEPLRNGKSVVDGDGAQVLRLSSLRSGSVDLAESKNGSWGAINPNRFSIHAGDFLVSRGNGSIDLVGRGGLVSDEPSVRMAFPDTMIRVRPNLSLLNPKYLRIIWDSRDVRVQIESAARTTAGIYKISQGDLEVLRIPLPLLAKQAEIVRRVESLFAYADRLESRLANARTAVDGLTPALLAKAFRGELVPQDPNDEPASELLRRLAESRQAAPAKPRRRRGA